MWGAFSNFFKKNSVLKEVQSGEDPAQPETGQGDCPEMDDSIITKQAKQRASIKWILSKAFNNKVPENLKEPFYQDHEGQEHLKPQIAGGLANAEIYCRALANIYSDPNYHSLSHTAILHAVARKGISVSESSDGAQLTETTLIQTNPLRMSAHMVVVESIMLLYAREVVTPDRVLAAVQRFTHNQSQPTSIPSNHEQALLLWLQMACHALRQRIEQDKDSGGMTNGGGDTPRIPQFPPCRDLKDLCDGVCLCGLLAFYCPDEVHWADIKISQIASVQGSLHNLRMIYEFCLRCLPASIFHLQAEDIFYLSESMRSNLIVFLADLFNVIEIHPANCIKEKFSGAEFPARNEHGVPHKRNLLQPVVTPIPDLRSSLDDPSTATAFQVNKSGNLPLRRLNSLQHSQQTLDFSEDSIQPRSESRANSEESFTVYRGRNVPTLRSIINDDPVIGRARTREKNNSEEREDVPAGRPSNWEENRKSGYAGRRSRRNSITDDSQLTIENFGGSQDNISFIGRNPDKEVGAHIGRKISAPSFPVAVENPRVRSSLQDAKGSFQIGYDYDNGCEKEDTMEKNRLKRQMSSDDITLRNLEKKDIVDGDVSNRISFADLGKQKPTDDYRGIQLVDREEYSTKQRNGSSEKKTTFDTLPNTTTWQQQSMNVQSHDNSNGNENLGSNNIMATQLNDIRLKLEEKRRHIESEKRRMEAAMNKQRQKVGKAAFLQAVSKGRANVKSAGSDSNESKGSSEASPSDRTPSLPELAPSPKPQRPFTLQDIPNDISNVERKWFDDTQPYIETRRTPDLENMDYEQYQKSIAQMNSSLTDIQSDIQQLAAQQNMLQFQNEQKAIVEQQRQLLQLQQQQFHLQKQQPYVSQMSYQQPTYQQPYLPSPLQSSSSAPHIPQSFAPQRSSQESQFFLHGNSVAPPPAPVAPPRRTWANHAQQQQQPQQQNDRPEMKTWGRPQPVEQVGRGYGNEQQGEGFMLHDLSKRLQDISRFQESSPAPRQIDNRYQNGGGDNDNRASSQANHSFTLSQQYHKQFGASNTPSASPQHHNIHRQISQLLDAGANNKRSSLVSLQQIDSGGGNTVVRERKTSVTHAPVAAPPADDMEPQNISFIGNSEDAALSEGLSRLNIQSGTRTYRIPSPTRPHISRNSFQPSPSPPLATELPGNREEDHTSQKGFYISFDNEEPKRPKPTLRNRNSPKKERSFVKSTEESSLVRPNKIDSNDKENRMERDRLQNENTRMEQRIEQEREKFRVKREASQERQNIAAASAMVIGELSNPNPETLDELERKKERILMLSLQRKQQLEEAKSKKEAEALRRRELEKAKEEEKVRKKEEQAARRAAILEQHKLKKAIEEAEREGKTLDPAQLQSLQSLRPTPKMRAKGGGGGRPRPKTIHIDSGSVQMAENMSSRGRKGSTSNLTYSSGNTMKRDYYRGSTDSLNDRSMSHTMLYKDSPDDSHGMVSPCHSTNPGLVRRSSYQRTSTSRDPSPAQVRGRPRVSTLQNFKGRKSSSMMNLYAAVHSFLLKGVATGESIISSNLGNHHHGSNLARGSSTDQDSFGGFRYGDTDSGLGRATPDRRAPSPGMRHLPSPSGPGSLPGLMSRGRRMFDDGSSDISSTPSSMMDYSGPRLYKQPTTKSNRSIMLNAVEYCVFPGVVNREAKRRVLEEINRSEAKHFLILFRDAGCQFRALYSYCPESELITKLYGTGPKQVNDNMFDRFFKYNSGGKCFSQVHTKHLTVTIDAFTIHNSLWQGKKVNLPNKKDMALVV